MADELGWVGLGVAPDLTGFKDKVERDSSKAMAAAGVNSGRTFGDAAGKSAGSRFGNAFKTAAKASLIGLGALGVGAIKLAGDSIAAASDLEESTNKVRQVFGQGADDVFRFSSKAADALGQTNQQARDAAATFGLFGNIAGLSDKKSAKFATRMTRLASDLASFHNTEPSQAVEALGAALRGEAEPIRSYGVLLDEATLKAEALRLGLLKPVKDQAKIKTYQVAILDGQQKYNEAVEEFGPKSLEALKAEAALGTARDRLKKATEGTIPPLTQQQKVLAAQSSIFKQTEVAQGDFARTSDGLANQQRRLSARFEDAKAKLGVGLLPIMTDAADFLLDKGIPAFEDFSEWFNKKGIPAIGNFTDEAKDAWGEVKKLVGFLGDLPDSVKIAGLAGLVTGGVKLKGLGFGKQGGIMGRGGALGAPVKVFETNPAAMGTGVGAGGKAGILTRIAGFVGKAALPVSVVAWSGVALKEFYDFNNGGPGKRQGVGMLGKGEFNKAWDRMFYDDDPIKARDAFDKVRSSAADVITAGEKAQATWRNFFGQVEKPHKVNVNNEPLLRALTVANDYSRVLDGLDGRVVQTFFESVRRNNTVEDVGGRGGKTPETAPSGVQISIGSVAPQNYNDFMQEMQRRTRSGSLDGRRTP